MCLPRVQFMLMKIVQHIQQFFRCKNTKQHIARYIVHLPFTRSAQARPIQTGITYAQATQGQHGRPQPNQTTTQTTISEQPPNEQGELKQMMTNLINQLNILINLITVLVSKSNN